MKKKPCKSAMKEHLKEDKKELSKMKKADVKLSKKMK